MISNTGGPDPVRSQCKVTGHAVPTVALEQP